MAWNRQEHPSALARRKGDDRSVEVQPQDEPSDGTSRAEGEKDQLAPCPVQLPPTAPESDPKHGKGNQFEKQKPKFAGIAKKKSRMDNVHSKSLVPDREITDSDEEVKEQCYHVMAMIEEPSVRHLSISVQ